MSGGLSLADKINLVFSTNNLRARIITIGNSFSSLGYIHNSGYSISQLSEGSPSEHLENLLDRILKEHVRDWEVDCLTWILSCLLYDKYDLEYIPDNEFDSLSLVLLNNYSLLPSWFTLRVDRDRLQAGTAVGLEYTSEELDWAEEYIKES